MKYWSLAVGCLLIAQNSFAQGFLGTKSDSVTTPVTSTSGPGWMQLLQLFLAVGFVLLLLRWLLPRALNRTLKRSVQKAGGSIRVEDTATIGGVPVYIVKAHDRRIMIAGGASGLSMLADLTSQTVPDSEPAFFEVLDRQAESAKSADRPEDILSQLERLGQ